MADVLIAAKVVAVPAPLFKGATHRARDTGEAIKAVHWVKDGDHKDVERYPVEKRTFKGLLKVVGVKDKFALRFGDWILEDAKGRVWVEAYESFDAKYEEAKP